MYLISINSGIWALRQYPDFHYVKITLGKDGDDFTKFDILANMPWAIKPIYGAICDSFYPFKYK